MLDTTAPDRISGKAATILRSHLGDDAILHNPILLKDATRSLVVRCRVTSARSGITSVIIKYIRDDLARGFDEWASLSFISGLPGARDLVPRFLGGDVGERLFIMEDLGGSRTLHDLLTEDDTITAESALQTMAIRMARLHGATVGREGEFESLRRDLPASAESGRRLEAERWFGSYPKLLAWFAAAGCAVPEGFQTAVKRVAAVYAAPGEFLCFTHGDPAPSNNHITDEDVRLLDFEYGGFRHALYDITAWNILCPLPSIYVHQMRSCFRHELSMAIPAAGDEEIFDEAWGCLCAYRALAILTWIVPDVLAENRQWVDESWTARHAVLAAMERLGAATAGVAELASITEAAARLVSALRRQWREFDDGGEVTTRWVALNPS